MSDALAETTVVCPYCFERVEVLVDLSAGDQSYIEDCRVCCRPIELELRVSGDDFHLEARRDDE